jgi:hypothetical protein
MVQLQSLLSLTWVRSSCMSPLCVRCKKGLILCQCLPPAPGCSYGFHGTSYKYLTTQAGGMLQSVQKFAASNCCVHHIGSIALPGRCLLSPPFCYVASLLAPLHWFSGRKYAGQA